MYTVLKKTLLAALPLAGLLMLPYPVLAYDNDDWGHHERYRDRHGDYHDGREDLHDEYHETLPSKRGHRRFHRWLNRDHYDFHDDRPDSYYDRHDRGKHQGWYQGRGRGKTWWYAEQPWRDGGGEYWH